MPEETPSFEEAFRELEETVQKLDAGELPLDESLALFERAMDLVGYCTKLLDDAELKVRSLMPGGEEAGSVPPGQTDETT
ncbi:MAG: exodeoxyribonuclease VII small subunit [Anaerolineae bacterium]